MLRTCIGADGSTAKDYPNYAENKIRFENGNGDLCHNKVDRYHGSEGAGSHQWGRGEPGGGAHSRNGHTDLKEAFSELLPEEIPGLPRHRPGEFSPSR